MLAATETNKLSNSRLEIAFKDLSTTMSFSLCCLDQNIEIVFGFFFQGVNNGFLGHLLADNMSQGKQCIVCQGIIALKAGLFEASFVVGELGPV